VIEISFFVPGLLSHEASSQQSLSSFLDNPLVGSADRIRIQLSASRGRAASLAVNHARSIVSELIGIREDVLELHVLAKETEDSPSEPVDFINARLEADILFALFTAQVDGMASANSEHETVAVPPGPAMNCCSPAPAIPDDAVRAMVIRLRKLSFASVSAGRHLRHGEDRQPWLWRAQGGSRKSYSSIKPRVDCQLIVNAAFERNNCRSPDV
jgi:hypothetical protein